MFQILWFTHPPYPYRGDYEKNRQNGLRWLKAFHMIAVACWIGGGVALILLYFLKGDIHHGGVLFGINKSIHHVDMLLIVLPGAIGCLITGLVYSIFSNWGFFKHNWIIFKWIITVSAILFGTFFLPSIFFQICLVCDGRQNPLERMNKLLSKLYFIRLYKEQALLF